MHNYYARVVIDKRIVALGTSLVTLAGDEVGRTTIFDLDGDDHSSAGGMSILRL